MKVVGAYKGKPLFIEEKILLRKGKLKRIDGYIITEIIPLELVQKLPKKKEIKND